MICTCSFKSGISCEACIVSGHQSVCRCVYFWAATSLLMSVVTFSLFVLMGHDLTAEVAGLPVSQWRSFKSRRLS